MSGADDLDLYGIAYVCGGPRRVVLVAVLALLEDGWITVAPASHRVRTVRRAPRDPVETAVLEEVPASGRSLGAVMTAAAAAPAVAGVGDALRGAGLLPRAPRAWWPRGAHRRLRDRPARSGDPGHRAPGRVGVHGVAAIEDAAVRRVFDTRDPSLRTKPPRRPRGRGDSPYGGEGTQWSCGGGGGGAE